MTIATQPLAVMCRDVVKTYDTGSQKVFALRGIDLDVQPGELLMLVGPSGCGKTTLISIIAGILDRDSGQCEAMGLDLQKLSSGARTKFRADNVGFVFQQFNLLPTLNAAENVSVPLLIRKMSRRNAMVKARAMLDRVSLGDRWKSMPSQLSGGQQQRVAIARALVHEPKLIVCDEPTSALDHDTGNKVMQLLRDVALAQGRSLIIVTHDARIFEFADRIARMDDGRVLSVETVNRQAKDLGHHASDIAAVTE